jgi:hypothetical protein
MAKGISIEVQGLAALKKKLGELPAHLVTDVDAELDGLSRIYVDRAQYDAPRNFGILAGAITYKRLGEMEYEVVSGAKYSAYVEFGTITQVRVPAELMDYAAQFKGKGIKKTGGMPARPFFFSQLPWARAEINKNLNEVVKRAVI